MILQSEIKKHMNDIERIDWWQKERPKSVVEELFTLEMKYMQAQLNLQVIILEIESKLKNYG